MITFKNILYWKFLNRKNRFLWEWFFENQKINFHIGDSWRIKELLFPENDIIIYKRQNPWKTEYSLIATKNTKNERILLNSLIHSKLVENYLKENNLKYQKEVKIWDSRIDFIIENNKIVEVKWCSLMIDKTWYFPDAPTTRWTKHLKELIKQLKKWYNCEVWFLTPNKISYFQPNQETDSDFSKNFYKFINKWWKVKFFKINTYIKNNQISFDLSNFDKVKIN